MVSYEKLTKAGVNMDALIKRLMGNDSLVRIFIKKFTEDMTFEQLKSAFMEKDIQKAEMASHTLKGMCGNLSLDELFELFSVQVNLLRGGEFAKAEEMMDIIRAKYNEALTYMSDWIKEN